MDAVLIEKNDLSTIYENTVESMQQKHLEQDIYFLLLEIPMLSQSQIVLYFGEGLAQRTIAAITRMKKKGVIVLADFMDNEADEHYMLRRNELDNLILDKPNPYINPLKNKREACILQKAFWVYLDFKKLGLADNFGREKSRYDFITFVFEMNHTTYDLFLLEKGKDYVSTFTLLKSLEKNYDEFEKNYIHRILIVEEEVQLADAQKYGLINGIEFYVLMDKKKGSLQYINANT